MPFYHYEMSPQDKATWAQTFLDDGDMIFSCPVECDGFACAAKVEIGVEDRDKEYDDEDEDDDDAPLVYRDFSGWATIALSVDESSAAVQIDCDGKWYMTSKSREGCARELLAQAMEKAVAALSKTPEYQEMMEVKELAHEMRVSIDAQPSAPAQRLRRAL